jgi:trehalose 6-phosphate synthase
VPKEQPLTSRSRLIIASNRLPAHRVTLDRATHWKQSAGGLVSAMRPVLSERRAIWVGWDGAPGRAARPRSVDGLAIAPVSLSRTQIAEFYDGFCNATLWPLYHDAIHPPEFHRDWWEQYRLVNARFADAVVRRAARGATVWIHDYHLQLAPLMLREARPDLRIGFFLHIPFPPEELFAWLPWRSAILRGLLGADLVAFHTESSSQNFSRAARRWSGAEGTDRDLTLAGRDIRVRPMPISIDFTDFEKLAHSPSVQRRAAEIRQSLGDRRVFLSVDRLDYTKGISHRLRAAEELFRDRRLSAENAVFIQIAVPTREDSPGYNQVRREVEELVGRINGMFSEPGRVAAHYFRRSLSREELVAYYLVADVMLVTPLRDGMNLVAKEYVAARHDLGGTLVLSEFAGAAWELRRALLVNPRDIEALKSTILQATRMPERDRRMRMSILRMQVRRHDVHHWASSFLAELE